MLGIPSQFQIQRKIMEILDLPNDNPQKAGETITSLSETILLNSTHHGAQTALAKKLFPDKFEANKSKVSRWCRGEFLDPHGRFTPNDFQTIVGLFWQQPNGIRSVEEVLALARCIGKVKFGSEVRNLVDLLNRDWLESLGYVDPEKVCNIPLPDNRYPRNTKLFLRNELMKTIEEIIPLAINSKQPIVIQGQPGTGKTTLINQISNRKQWESLGSQKTFYLNEQGIISHLRAWYDDLIGVAPAYGMRQDDLIGAIRMRTSGRNCLILMDNVSSVEHVSPILDALNKTNQFAMILTTHEPGVARKIAHHHHLQVTMPGFAPWEAKRYYKVFFNREVSANEEEAFNKLVKSLKGNPLGLYFAFQRLHDMQIRDLLELLQSVQKEIPDKMLSEVFLPLQVGFERMPPELRRKFIRLGAMERFYSIDHQTLAALWEDSIVGTSNLIIPEMQKLISPFQATGTGEGNWRLHEQTHLFAISKFCQLNLEEKKTALNWTKRLEDVYECSDPSSEKALEADRLMGIKPNIPPQNRAGQFQNFDDMFRRIVRHLFENHNYYWEIIQKEIPHISSYEYFICNKLQQQESKYLKNIRIWLLSMVALLAINISTDIRPDRLSRATYVSVIIIWAIYSIKLYRVDLVGIWISKTQCQAIWDSVSSRILGKIK
jgi:hypothetical protein